MIELLTQNLFLALRSLGSSSHALVDYHLERGGMPLHGAVGVKLCKEIIY